MNIDDTVYCSAVTADYSLTVEVFCGCYKEWGGFSRLNNKHEKLGLGYTRAGIVVNSLTPLLNQIKRRK